MVRVPSQLVFPFPRDLEKEIEILLSSGEKEKIKGRKTADKKYPEEKSHISNFLFGFT